MVDIESVLRKTGLTEGEIKVYLALVELGSVTVGPIIDKANVSNSKIYILLEKLIQKGLASFVMKEKTRYYQASRPISLLAYVDEQEKKLHKTKGELKDAITEIEALQNLIPDEESAKIYKGYKGVRTGIFETVRTIPSQGSYYFFSIGYGSDLYLQQFFRDLAQELKRRKIKIKGLAGKSEKGLYEGYYSKVGYLMRYTSVTWPADTAIVGDYLLFLVWKKKEPILYALHSRTLVDAYKNLFEKLWEKAKA